MLTRSPSSSLKPQRNEQNAASVSSLSLTTSASLEDVGKSRVNSGSTQAASRPSTIQRYSSNSMASSGKQSLETRVDDLMYETRLWRLACSAQWVAWGIVQARVPGFEDKSPANEQNTEKAVPSQSKDFEDVDEDEEFDYLSYARERSLLFWGDCILMGLIKEHELPEEVRKHLKIVDR